MIEHKWSTVLKAFSSENYTWNLLIEKWKKNFHGYDSMRLYWFSLG